MTPEAVRLEALKLTATSVSNPDLQAWVERARVVEAYITGAGQISTETPHETPKEAATQARANRQSRGPAR